MKGSNVLKILCQKTQNIAEKLFILFFKHKGFFTIPVFAAIAVVVVGGILLTPQPANAGWFLPALAVGAAGLFVTGAADDFFQAILAWIGDLLAGTVAGIVTALTALVNFVLLGISWVAKTIMEYVLNLTLTANYTNTLEPGVIQAGWPIVRDLANMGLILVLVAIGLSTILNLQQGKLRSRLGIFMIVGLLINFSPLLTGIVIDLSNVTARIFFDSAQQISNAFMAGLPFQDTVHQIGQGFIHIGKGIIGQGNLGMSDLLTIILVSVSSILFNLFLIFAYLILALLFLGRTLALWILVIFSPLAFLAAILPSTQKWFATWRHNFFQWSLIVIPLIFSLWVAGIFLNNNQWCSGGEHIIDSNIGTYTTENSKPTLQSDQDPLAGQGYGPIAQAVANQEDVCKMTTMLLAFGALGAGIMMSLKSSAAGSRFITSRAKTYYTKAVKAAGRATGRRAELAAYRTGKRVREGEGRIPGLIRGTGRGISKVPGMSRLGRGVGKVMPFVPGYEATRRKAAGRKASRLEEWKKIKDYDSMSSGQLTQALSYTRDTERRRKILDLLANDKHRKEFVKYWREDLDKGGREKLSKDIANQEKLFPGTIKTMLKAHPLLIRRKAIRDSLGDTVHDRINKSNKLVSDVVKDASQKDMDNWHPSVFMDSQLVEEMLKQNRLTRRTLEGVAKNIDKLTNLEKTLTSIEEKRGEKAGELMNEVKNNLRNIQQNPKVAALYLATPKKINVKNLTEEERQLLKEELENSDDEEDDDKDTGFNEKAYL